MSNEPPEHPGQVQHQVAYIENTGYSYRAHCACGRYATKHYRTEASACRAAQQHADDRNAARRASGSAETSPIKIKEPTLPRDYRQRVYGPGLPIGGIPLVELLNEQDPRQG